jgi:hypothetical protein
MVLTPVSSVFGHYSNITNFLSAKRVLTVHNVAGQAPGKVLPALRKPLAVADLAENRAPASTEHCQSPNTSKIFCYAGGSCGSHSCGDGAATAVFLFTQVDSVYCYRHLENTSARSVVFSPEIKPPI